MFIPLHYFPTFRVVHNIVHVCDVLIVVSSKHCSLSFSVPLAIHLHGTLCVRFYTMEYIHEQKLCVTPEKKCATLYSCFWRHQQGVAQTISGVTDYTGVVDVHLLMFNTVSLQHPPPPPPPPPSVCMDIFNTVCLFISIGEMCSVYYMCVRVYVYMYMYVCVCACVYVTTCCNRYIHAYTIYRYVVLIALQTLSDTYLHTTPYNYFFMVTLMLSNFTDIISVCVHVHVCVCVCVCACVC